MTNDLATDFLMKSQLLTEEAVATVLGVEVDTLRQLRSRDRGPEAIKCGRAVFYSYDAVRSYITSGSPLDKASSKAVVHSLLGI